MRTKILAHSRSDALLVSLALAQLAVLVFGVLSFGRVAWGTSLILALVSIFLMCTNFQCIAHNFIHNPFFKDRRLNLAFSILNSTLIGGSQSLYRIHHLHHHKYNNDAPDPRTGTTKDLTSTWRYSPWPWREESFWSYALVGYFRSDFGFLLREVRRKGLFSWLTWEVAAFSTLLVAMGLLNPRGLVLFYLPVWYLGNAAAQAENFLEHYGATPGDRKTDSVSSYGRLYNLIWFNNGYHQEHHYRPQTHWTRIPEVRDLLPPESARRVVRGAHWFNFGVRRESPPSVSAVRPASQPASARCTTG